MSAGLSPVRRPLHWINLATAVGIGAALIWAYWPALGDMVSRWAEDPRYSHGYLVVGFAVVLLLMRARSSRRPSAGRTDGDWC